MDAKTFLDNFGAIAEAPGGIERLRDLILNLALSGRLMSEHRAARATGGPPSQSEEGDDPTLIREDRLPSSWSIAKASELGQLVRGVTYKKSDATGAPALGRIALLRANNIDGDTNYDDLVYVPIEVVKPEQHLLPGDFLICMSSGSKRLVGKASPITEEREATFGAFCSVFRVNEQLRSPLLALWFKSPLYRDQISAASRGIGINNLRRGDLESLMVPLPPLPEQELIVAKVDELMQLCDDLEARQQARHHVTTRLRASSLDALTNAETDNDLRTAWSRIQTNWEALTDSEDGIEQLRQAALLLAVKGRLVPQEPEDQHADASIRQAKAELEGQAVVRGRGASRERIAGRGALSVGEPAAMGLPAGWAAAPLSSVTRLESGHTPDRKISEYWDGPFPWIGIRDARRFRNGTVFETENTVSLEGINNSATRLLPAGTVCLSRTASVGYAVVMGREMCTSQDFVNFLCTSAIAPRYLQLIFRAEGEALRRFSKGAVHQTIYFPEVKAFHVLLPPRPEQERILTKVDELMRTCDELATHIEKRDSAQARSAASICAHTAAN